MKNIKIKDLPKKNIAIGSVGGITGGNEKLIYLKNGLIFKFVQMPGTEATIVFEKKITKTQAKKIFKVANNISFSELATTKPGNMNTYIERNRWLRKDSYFQWNTELDSTNNNHKFISKLILLSNQ